MKIIEGGVTAAKGFEAAATAAGIKYHRVKLPEHLQRM